jgi:hypothetical protein
MSFSSSSRGNSTILGPVVTGVSTEIVVHDITMNTTAFVRGGVLLFLASAVFILDRARPLCQLDYRGIIVVHSGTTTSGPPTIVVAILMTAILQKTYEGESRRGKTSSLTSWCWNEASLLHH